jgi:hypothetical protein
MDYSVEETQPDVWRVSIAGITRIIRYRSDTKSFAPWDVTDADGHTLYSASSLESAFRWIQARTGYPAEALFAQTLLEHNARITPARSGDVSTAPEALQDAHVDTPLQSTSTSGRS